ncbi:protein SRC2 homolog isoform X1 [Juglans microcarpa x Juglans regia]|uniref:protein SRC2 homolog isoform X1 n=2 Tax=Juglans microcarpa x Juglans regia TaxID=2249226 RepID=UPI001B7E5B0B|nr:protein SRC2 homolog isoform X1 [Juglans microcarpa x Juglans regia]
MEPSSIELKVLSCKDLRAFNFFQKLSAYTLVSLVSDDPSKKLEQNQQQRTPNDLEGDGNPDWNHEMRFDLNEVSLEDYDHLFIHFDVRHQGLMFGDKTIGEVHVHLKDLIEESNFGVVRFVSYQVRTTDGRPNGVLSFSCKVNGKGKNNNMGTGSEFPVIHDQQTSHEIHYPSLELQKLSEESLSFAPQQVHFLLPGMQYPSYRAYHPPPDAYYPPPPPPPHGACYHPSRPQWVYPWAPDLDKLGGGYDYYGAAHGTPGRPVLAQSRGTDNNVGEAWSNSDSRAGNDREDPFWNGRGWKGYLEPWGK